MDTPDRFEKVDKKSKELSQNIKKGESPTKQSNRYESCANDEREKILSSVQKQKNKKGYHRTEVAEHKNKTQAIFYRYCVYGISIMVGVVFLLTIIGLSIKGFGYPFDSDVLHKLCGFSINILIAGIGVLIADPVKSIVGIK